MSETTQTDEYHDPNVTRRRAMQLGAGAALAVAGAGVAIAEGGDLNYSSDMTPNPEVHGSVMIDSHSLDDAPLGYTDDDGEDANLADNGAYIRDRDEDDEPLNPVRLYADAISSSEYYEFPRGETYEDEDEEEIEVSALEPEYWDEVDAEISVESWTPPNGDKGLEISSDGLDPDQSAVARFDAGDDWDFEIDSGEMRRYIQLGVNITELSSGSIVRIRVRDAYDDYAEVRIDPDGDTEDDDVIATGTASGLVSQVQIGDIASDLDTLQEIEVEIEDVDATIEVFAFNVERESRWTFGVEEYLDEDDELQTSTIYEPSGQLEIRDRNDLTDTFGDGEVEEIEYLVGFEAAGVSDDHVDVVDANPGRFRFDERLEVAQSLEIPSAYDLSYADLELVERVRHPSDRYNEVMSGTGFEEPVEVEDVDEDDMTDRTAELEDGSDDDLVTLETTVQPGETAVVYQDLLLTDDEHDEITSDGVAGGPFGGGDGGFLSTPIGMGATIISGIAGYFAIAKGWLTGSSGG